MSLSNTLVAYFNFSAIKLFGDKQINIITWPTQGLDTVLGPQTHRVIRQCALIPELVLFWVIFALFPVGGTEQPVHEERYDHLCHLVHQLGNYQQ